jgi:flagellar basal-body rod modification protein FlgD
MALTTEQISKTTQINFVEKADTGFNGLTSDDFLKILIEQLKNQDPSNPMSSDQLLDQVSQMRALQSSIELSQSLEALTMSQQLTSATSFLGKEVTATGADNQNVTGTVDRVVVKSGKTLLGIGTNEYELGKVVSIQ